MSPDNCQPKPQEREPTPRFIPQPTVIAPAGNKPKRIEEQVGRVNSGPEQLSVARMRSPAGAEYVAVCLPAFAPETMHRDAE